MNMQRKLPAALGVIVIGIGLFASVKGSFGKGMEANDDREVALVDVDNMPSATIGEDRTGADVASEESSQPAQGSESDAAANSDGKMPALPSLAPSDGLGAEDGTISDTAQPVTQEVSNRNVRSNQGTADGSQRGINSGSEQVLAQLSQDEIKIIGEKHEQLGNIDQTREMVDPSSAAEAQPGKTAQPAKMAQPSDQISPREQALLAQNQILQEQQEKLLSHVIEYRKQIKQLSDNLAQQPAVAPTPPAVKSVDGVSQADLKLARELQEVRSGFLASQDQIRQLQAKLVELQSADTERSLLQGKVASLLRDAGERKDLKLTLDSALADNGVLKEKIRDLQQSVAKSQSELRQIGDTERSEKEKIIAENQQLKAGVDRALLRIQALSKAKSEAEQQAQSLQVSVRLLTDERDKLAKESDVLTQQAQLREGESSELKRQLARATEEGKSSATKLVSLTDQLKKSEGALDGLKECRASMVGIQQELTHKVEVENKFTKASAELARAQNKLLLCQADQTAFGKVKTNNELVARVQNTNLGVQAVVQPQPQAARMLDSTIVPPIDAVTAGGTEKGMMVVQVRQPKGTLRLGPGNEHSALMEVQKGTELVVESREGDWYRVTAPTGRSAYVRADVVAPVTAKSAASDVKVIEDEGLVPFGNEGTPTAVTRMPSALDAGSVRVGTTPAAIMVPSGEGLSGNSAPINVDEQSAVSRLRGLLAKPARNGVGL